MIISKEKNQTKAKMSLRSSPQPMSDGSWDKTSLAPSPFGWENWGIHFTVSQTFPIGLGSSHPVVVGLSLSFIGYLPSLSHFPTPLLLFSVLPKETTCTCLLVSQHVSGDIQIKMKASSFTWVRVLSFPPLLHWFPLLPRSEPSFDLWRNPLASLSSYLPNTPFPFPFHPI